MHFIAYAMESVIDVTNVIITMPILFQCQLLRSQFTTWATCLIWISIVSFQRGYSLLEPEQ